MENYSKNEIKKSNSKKSLQEQNFNTLGKEVQ